MADVLDELRADEESIAATGGFAMLIVIGLAAAAMGVNFLLGFVV